MTAEIEELRKQNDNFQKALSVQRNELEVMEKSKQEMTANMSYLDESIDQMSLKHQDEVKAIKEQFDQQHEIVESQAAREHAEASKQIDVLMDQVGRLNAEI